MDGEKELEKVLMLGSGMGANDESNVLFASYGHDMNELSMCSSLRMVNPKGPLNVI